MTPFADNDIIVVDLGFGDAGKGATVDYLLARRRLPNVSAVVRFNGGAQAAHNVVVGGRHHTFSVLGSERSPEYRPSESTHARRTRSSSRPRHRQPEDLGIANPLQLIHIDNRALPHNAVSHHDEIARRRTTRRREARIVW